MGFIVGSYIHLALSNNYTQQIESTIARDLKLIEIKKQMTFERKERSKVLAVDTVKSEAEDIDFAMVNLKFKNFRYLSYKHSISSQRIAVMHSNELVNIRARFETLYRVNLQDKVNKDNEESTLAEVL